MKLILKENLRAEIDALRRNQKEFQKDLPLEMFRVFSIFKAAVQQNIRTRMNVVTGFLLNSPQIDIKVEKDKVIGTLQIQNVPYAAAQEFGHEFLPVFISPRHKKALSWIQDGKRRFSKGHVIGRKKKRIIKPKHYFRDGIQDNIENVRKRLQLFSELTIGKK